MVVGAVFRSIFWKILKLGGSQNDLALDSLLNDKYLVTIHFEALMLFLERIRA